jgi:PAS domain S-box-containing protein
MSKKEDRYQQLVENLTDAIYTVDSNTLHFTSLNSAGERMTGFSRDEFIKKNVSEIILPEYLPLVKKMISRKRNEALTTVYEVEMIRKDGRRIPIEVSSVALYENNKPHEFLGIARDITERKIIEKQREVFLSLITHEIKNPLTSAILFVDLLQKKLKKDKKSLEYLHQLSSSMASINKLLTDMLDITQMRIGRFQINKSSLDLNEAISDVIKTFGNSPNIKIEGKVTKNLLVDKSRICQVIMNLLSNALKYSPKDKSIVITLTEKEKKVIVSVQDFGPGILQTDQKQIFDLFYRSIDASQSETKGHGLGLFICKEIIKQHKGKLWVKSTPPSGSTFYFSLPI